MSWFKCCRRLLFIGFINFIFNSLLFVIPLWKLENIPLFLISSLIHTQMIQEMFKSAGVFPPPQVLWQYKRMTLIFIN